MNNGSFPPLKRDRRPLTEAIRNQGAGLKDSLGHSVTVKMLSGTKEDKKAASHFLQKGRVVASGRCIMKQPQAWGKRAQPENLGGGATGPLGGEEDGAGQGMKGPVVTVGTATLPIVYFRIPWLRGMCCRAGWVEREWQGRKLGNLCLKERMGARMWLERGDGSRVDSESTGRYWCCLYLRSTTACYTVARGKRRLTSELADVTVTVLLLGRDTMARAWCLYRRVY